MTKVPIKNYIILVVLLLATILLTFGLSNIYNLQNKTISAFYKYSNKIKPDDFDIYMLENPDSIIYISDKYDLSYKEFEESFKAKIDELNLHDRLVYIDKNEIQEKFISKLQKKYEIDIKIEKTPVVIVIIDNKNLKNIYINEDTDVDTFIDYKVFK